MDRCGHLMRVRPLFWDVLGLGTTISYHFGAKKSNSKHLELKENQKKTKLDKRYERK